MYLCAHAQRARARGCARPAHAQCVSGGWCRAARCAPHATPRAGRRIGARVRGAGGGEEEEEHPRDPDLSEHLHVERADPRVERRAHEEVVDEVAAHSKLRARRDGDHKAGHARAQAEHAVGATRAPAKQRTHASMREGGATLRTTATHRSWRWGGRAMRSVRLHAQPRALPARARPHGGCARGPGRRDAAARSCKAVPASASAVLPASPRWRA